MPKPRVAGPDYTCAKCHGTFAREWTDAEALAELDANFGPVDEKGLAIVCDDCYQAFWASGIVPKRPAAAPDA